MGRCRCLANPVELICQRRRRLGIEKHGYECLSQTFSDEQNIQATWLYYVNSPMKPGKKKPFSGVCTTLASFHPSSLGTDISSTL